MATENQSDVSCVLCGQRKRRLALLTRPDFTPSHLSPFGIAELGLALRGVPREAFFLHTKVGRYEASVTRMFDFTYERTVASVEESLQRLGLDYVDTIQVHDPEFAPSIDTVLQETLPALAEAQRRGWVRSIGITGYPLPVLLELAERSPVPIASALTYCHCTLASDELVASGTLAALAAQGIAVLNGSPLGMGLLTQGGPQPWHPASAELKRRAAAAAQWCTSRGFAIERLAMGHCLETAARSPGITSTISATIDPDEMRANIALATGEKPLSHEERQALASVRALFFGNDLPAQDRSWEGVEVTKYWVKLGKAREGERYAAAAASRAAGLSIPAAHERLA